jgi:hypothetical protein
MTYQQPDTHRITALEQAVNTLRHRYETQFGNEETEGVMVSLITTMAADLKEVSLALRGDTPDGRNGLLVRIDRLEQWKYGATWWIRALATAGLGELIYIILRHN